MSRYNWEALEAMEQECLELGIEKEDSIDDGSYTDSSELLEDAEIIMTPSELEAFKKYLEEADSKLESYNASSLY